MSKLRQLVLAIAAALSPVVALAQPAQGVNATLDCGKLLDTVALNGSAASRTFSITEPTYPTPAGACRLSGYSQMNVTIKFVHVNDGALTTTCTFSPDSGTTDATPTTCTLAAGACTLNWAGTFATPSLSANKTYTFPLGVKGYREVECVTTHGGAPAAGDKLNVWVEMTNG